jgi:hypothetical protein
MMSTRRRQFALLALVATTLSLGGAGATFLHRSTSKAHERASAAFQWREGFTYGYLVDWSSHAQASVATQGALNLGSLVRLKGKLEFRSLGLRGSAMLIDLKVATLDYVEASALGRALGTQDALRSDVLDAETVLLVEPSGVLVDIRFSEHTPDVARHLLRAMMVETFAELAAAEGVSEIHTSVGHATTTRSESPDGKTITTHRVSYDALTALSEGLDPSSEGELTAKGTIVRHPDHGLQSLSSTERVSIDRAPGTIEAYHSQVDLSLELEGATRSTPRSVPAFADVPSREKDAGLHGAAPGSREASLARRAAGVTPESLYADVREAAVLPKAHGNEWIWHDSAYLELHPEQAKPLLERASRELGVMGQAAAFDILVIPGTPAAQTVLVDALRTLSEPEEDVYITLIQRLGHLRQPTEATARFIEDEHAKRRGTPRGRAAAYALGAIAGAMEAEAPSRAESLLVPLVSAVKHATVFADKEAAIRGLGNAGIRSSLEIIAAENASPSVEVRRAVASALRKFDEPRAAETLVSLIGDSDTSTAVTAMQSLFRYDLSPSIWDAIERAYREGHIAKGAENTLVSALSEKRGEDPHAIGLLVAMVASPETSVEARQRAESILRQ